MNRILGSAILLGSLCFSGAFTAHAALQAKDLELFEKANQFYYGEKYGEARKLYADLAERYPGYGALAYNLGNANVRLGKTGPAILAYEKALREEPRNSDIQKNLDYVRSRLPYKLEDKRNWYLRAGETVLKKLTEKEVDLLAALAYLLFMTSLLVPLFFRGTLPFGFVQKAFGLLLAAALLLYAAKSVESRFLRDAVVMSKKADVRFGPSDGDRVAFKLGEGLKVYVIDRRENWSRILLANGESGWIKNDAIAEVSARVQGK